MQTPILIQSSQTGPLPQSKAGAPAAIADNGDFQRTLTRQLEQRQAQNNAAQAQPALAPRPQARIEPAAAPAARPQQAPAPWTISLVTYFAWLYSRYRSA